MSPELDTLDQLLGGPMALSVVRSIFPDETAFLAGVHALLRAGEVRLLDRETGEVPAWRWRSLLIDGQVLAEPERFTLDITDTGVRRIRG